MCYDWILKKNFLNWTHYHYKQKKKVFIKKKSSISNKNNLKFITCLENTNIKIYWKLQVSKVILFWVTNLQLILSKLGLRKNALLS